MKVWLAKRHWTKARGYHMIWREARLSKKGDYCEVWSLDDPPNLLVGHMSEKLMAGEITAGRLTLTPPTGEPRQ